MEKDEKLVKPEVGEKLLFRWSQGDFITKVDLSTSPADPESDYVELEVVSWRKAQIDFVEQAPDPCVFCEEDDKCDCDELVDNDRQDNVK